MNSISRGTWEAKCGDKTVLQEPEVHAGLLALEIGSPWRALDGGIPEKMMMTESQNFYS